MHRHMVKSVIILFLGLQSLANALPTDRQKVINVIADTADISQATHKGVYKGHVELEQGTTNLRAIQAETYGNEKNQLILAIARGDKSIQAHYWTMTAEDKPLLHAYADIIRYYPMKHLITLTGNAKVIQGTNSFSAAKITYDTIKQHVVSESNGDTRTKMVIYPEKKHS